MAGINFSVHRVFTFLLDKERLETEKKTTRKIAEHNGYSPIIVNTMICKRQCRLRMKNL